MRRESGDRQIRGSSLRAVWIAPRVQRRCWDRQLARSLDRVLEYESPARELGAIAEVEVLGHRVVGPAARLFDAGPPPDARGPVEVEEHARVHPCRMLDPEMSVEHRGLRGREGRAGAVQVGPAGLHHPDRRVGEVRCEAKQEIGGGNEVGVEHGDQLAASACQPVRQRAGLEPLSVRATQVVDVHATCAMARHRERGALGGLVVRVIEHLDLEPARRVVECGRGVDQTGDDPALVEDRQLDGDRGRKSSAGVDGASRGAPVPCTPPSPQEQVAMRRVEDQQDLGAGVADDRRELCPAQECRERGSRDERVGDHRRAQ